MAAGSCGSKNNASQDPHDPPGYVRDILFGAPPARLGNKKREDGNVCWESNIALGAVFFNTLSLRAFPGHVAISGLGSRQQPKKKNTTV